jgi:hypothetical protein
MSYIPPPCLAEETAVASPLHRPLKRPRSQEEQSLPPCDMCKERERAYCCPRCGIKTCSLACCKAHKAQVGRGRLLSLMYRLLRTNASVLTLHPLTRAQQTGCSGRRDRFSHVPISQFTDAQLRSGE